VPIPKAAFASEGACTEFRRMILDKLHIDRPSTSYPIEFTHCRSDFWRAKLLHTFRGGGWRRLAKIVLISCAFLCAIAGSFSSARGGHAPAFLIAIAIAAFVFFLSRVIRWRDYYTGPLWIYFSEAGLHVADPASQSRRRWSELAGYLEGRHIYLLYINSQLYRIIPKRALGHRDGEFRRLLEASVPLFNYRRPAPVPNAARV